jgi:hypothetical protein
MSRSGYVEDFDCEDQWAQIRWRGAVKSAIRGKRGQAFFKEMLAALDALPEKKLVAQELEEDGQVCALGAVGLARKIDMSEIDAHDPSTVASVFDVNEKIASEVAWMNDDAGPCTESPEKRFERMRAWVIKQINAQPDTKDPTP